MSIKTFLFWRKTFTFGTSLLYLFIDTFLFFLTLHSKRKIFRDVPSPLQKTPFSDHPKKSVLFSKNLKISHYPLSWSSFFNWPRSWRKSSKRTLYNMTKLFGQRKSIIWIENLNLLQVYFSYFIKKEGMMFKALLQKRDIIFFWLSHQWSELLWTWYIQEEWG